MSVRNGDKWRTNSANPDLYTGVPTVDNEDGRNEKPWQRIPCPLIIVLLGVYLLLGYLTQLVEDDMPRVISDANVARDNSEIFSEEAAWRYLHVILGDGPRVSGTKYHLQKTADLKSLVDSIAADANQHIQTTWQMTSGDYWLTFSPPMVNVYQNVSNVAALLEGESGFLPNGTLGTTLLVNCHYDSVPYAMGASDDAIFCAVMVETMRKLARRPQKLKHNVIFLFNGAEENNLHGSHGFLSHPWARGITNVINLDSAGINGKPIVFQVTDPRVLAAYERVTYRPNGQSVGEFLFSAGIVPSDTDFRIWRDFGNFHGIDIAFVKGGHVYHTRYDHPDTVRTGVIQNAGNMLLATVREAADMEVLNTQIEPSASVYYDYLNWFMVTYSYGAAIAVDILIALFGLSSVAYFVWMVGPRLTTIQELLFSVLGRFLSMLAGIVVSLIVVPIMVVSTTQMRYLSEPWVVVPLYWMPYILTAVGTSQAFDAWRTKKSGLNRSIRTLQAMAATRLIMVAVLLLLCCIPPLNTVRYVFTVPLFIMCWTSLISLTVVRYVRMQAWMHLIMEVLLSIPATMFMFTVALRVDSLMLPTVGRSHSDTPDYNIAIINVGLAIVVPVTVSGIELLFSRKRFWLVVAPLGIICFVLFFIPFYPYRDEGPATQRHYWFHSDIVSYDYNNAITHQETGILVTKYDPYTLTTVIPALRERNINLLSKTDFTEDCERYVHCNLPLFRVRFGNFLHDSLFLFTGGPAPFQPESSTRVVRSCVGETCNFQFNMTGPAHNLLTLWPRAGVELTSWTFATPVQWSFLKDVRPVYVIVQSTPTYSDVFLPLQFNVTFRIPVSQQQQPAVDFAHHAHKINHPEDYTAEYRNIVTSVPKYFNVASFLSFRRNYIF